MASIDKMLIVTGCLLLSAAAMLSAYGFHGLEAPIEKIESWKWAVEMQYYHSFGLVIIGAVSAWLGGSALLRLAGGGMIAGMLIFSGLIYAEVLGAPESIGEIVPFGGTLFMVSWLLFAIGILRTGSRVH